MTAQPPLPDKWIKFLMDIYTLAQPPILGTVDLKEIEANAREVMRNHLRAFRANSFALSMADQRNRLLVSAAAYMYTFGSAGTCSTDLANKKSFENWKIIPRMLIGATNRILEVCVR